MGQRRPQFYPGVFRHFHDETNPAARRAAVRWGGPPCPPSQMASP